MPSQRPPEADPVSPPESQALDLPPRLRQTLELLLEGCSEQEAAMRLNLSRHTIHDYVKDLYRRFGVTSRAQLLARWTRRQQGIG